jgi:transposase, IS6 family
MLSTTVTVTLQKAPASTYSHDHVRGRPGAAASLTHPVSQLEVRAEVGGQLHQRDLDPPGPCRGSTQRRGWMAVPVVERSAFAGFRFPPEVITVAVRWYLRYTLSYRDLEELLAERGIEVDHVTVYRWVQRFTPLVADAARPCRHATGDRWFVDETYVKVAGRWRYLYRAVDQYGQVIDVLVSQQRDSAAARRFFTRALTHGPAPVEVTTDKAVAYLLVLADLLPGAMHLTEQYATDEIVKTRGLRSPGSLAVPSRTGNC